MSTRNKAFPGADVPALHLSFFSMIWRKPSTESLPLPTSTSVPTMARTMLRKKRSACIVKTHSSSPVCSPDGLHDTAVIGFHVRMELAETCEIGILQQRARSLVHPPEIQPLEYPPHIHPVERIFPCGDIILISAVGGIEAGMRILADTAHLIYGDVGRKDSVQLVSHQIRISHPFQIEMRHHQTCMHAGIRTSGLP